MKLHAAVWPAVLCRLYTNMHVIYDSTTLTYTELEHSHTMQLEQVWSINMADHEVRFVAFMVPIKHFEAKMISFHHFRHRDSIGHLLRHLETWMTMTKLITLPFAHAHAG